MMLVNKNILKPAAVFALSLSVLLAGCDAQSSHSEQNSKAEQTRLPDSIKVVERISSTKASFTLEDFISRSSLISLASYTGQSTPILIEPSNGNALESSYYTDYYFKVMEPFKGSARCANDSIITARSAGGIGEKMAVINDSSPQLTEGEEYLLFLYEIDGGAEYHTESNPYYFIGDNDGIWRKSGNDEYQSPVGEGSVSLSDLSSKLATVADLSKDKTAYNEFMDDLKARYESGDLPAESYFSYIENEERLATSYATELKGDEAKACEDAIVAAQEEQQTTSSDAS